MKMRVHIMSVICCVFSTKPAFEVIQCKVIITSYTHTLCSTKSKYWKISIINAMNNVQKQLFTIMLNKINSYTKNRFVEPDLSFIYLFKLEMQCKRIIYSIKNKKTAHSYNKCFGIVDRYVLTSRVHMIQNYWIGLEFAHYY